MLYIYAVSQQSQFEIAMLHNSKVLRNIFTISSFLSANDGSYL